MGRGRGGEGTMHQEMGGQIMVQGVGGGGGAHQEGSAHIMMVQMQN